MTAERLCPRGYPFGTKRPCLESGYYEAFNLPHVCLVDLKATPISTVTASSIELETGELLACDAIILATGYDAITGALVAVDIVGQGGRSLAERWREGAASYLGLMVEGFPNLFTVTGPGAPAALTNAMASIEHHVEWVTDCLIDLRARRVDRIEPTPKAQDGWVRHCADWAAITLFPRADSWYMGANVPGKPRVFMSYLGGMAAYRQICSEVVSRDYLGFRLTSRGREQCQDGVVRGLQPDVELVMNAVAALNLPALNTLSPDGARTLRAQMSAQRPPGPQVASVRDGELPARDGHQIGWRLHRPDASRALPLIVYFHGGGWVLGDLGSDDPLCRDLCVRTRCAVLSINYRHAPEWRFPTAVHDAEDGLSWALANASALDVHPGQTLVAGWSAGANLATVVSRRLRDAGNSTLRGQLLITPVTDADFSRTSFAENAEGYGLTTDLMRWFWSHYADGAERHLPDASPLRASHLAGLPPAVIVTCEFDPLRDEGNDYARALEEAGVPVQHLQARGHTHLSLTMVDVIASGASIRTWIAGQVGGLLQ